MVQHEATTLSTFDSKSRGGGGGDDEPRSTTVVVMPTVKLDDDGKTQAQEQSSESPVYRAVAIAWLAQFVKAHTGTTQSWDVVKEFMAREDGGGTDTVLTVTPNNLETHRDKRRAAEKTKSGKPVPVEYRDIPFEQMYTTDIVECFVRSLARKKSRVYSLNIVLVVIRVRGATSYHSIRYLA